MSDLLNLLPDPNATTTTFTLPEAPKRYIFSRIPSHPNDLLLRLDNSSLEVFNTCPRAAQYKLIHSREAPPSPALFFGTQIHRCLEQLYLHGFTPEVFNNCKSTLAHAFTTNPFPSNEWRSFDVALSLLASYYNRYYNDLSTYQPLHVERHFSLPLCTLDLSTQLPLSPHELLGEPDHTPVTPVHKVHVYWSGKIDLIARSADTTYFFDHKTSSVLGEQFINSFELSQQTLGYAWAVTRLLSLPTPPTFLLNILGCRKPTKSGTAIELLRHPFTYTPDQLAEWELDVQHLVSTFLSHLTSSYFPKSSAWCFSKYGRCPYFTTCTLPPSARLPYLNSPAYSNVSWTPFTE